MIPVPVTPHEEVALGPDVVFQGQFALGSGKLTGVEALARPTDGPGGFSTAAKVPGLAAALDRSIMARTCQYVASWADELASPAPRVSINVSPTSLAARDLPVLLEDSCRLAGIAPAGIRLELTESSEIPTSAAYVVEDLVARGFSISIDDFGTGYSSVHRIASLPVDEVKIAGELLWASRSSARALLLLRRSVAMLEECGYHVVIEGIETEADLLAARSVSSAAAGQGFALARPVGAGPFRDAWLREST